MVRIILIMLISLSLPATAMADTYVAESCSAAHVQAAVDLAADDDLVTVPAGECTWTAQVSVTNKNITVQGNGIDSTIITANITTGTRPGVFKVTTKPAKITGFTFTGTAPTYGAHLVFEGTGDETALFRVTGNKFTVNSGYAILTWALSYGLIDNNSFTTTTDHTFIDIYADNRTSWGRASSFSTNATVTIENNTFTNTDANNANYRPITSDGGGRFLFRYNTVTNQAMDMHGYCGNGAAGTMQYEVYNNDFILQAGRSMARWMFIRGGTGVVFKNQMVSSESGQPAVHIDLGEYRLNSTESCYGDAISCCTTYPCQDQIGRGTDQALAPVYFWSNTVDGGATVVQASNLDGPTDPCDPEPDVSGYIQLNRDYYTTAKSGYTPYTCPHPSTGLTGKYCDDTQYGTTGYGLDADYALTVTKVGTGTVTSSPSGVSCGETCEFSYESGDVTLSAASGAGYFFHSWSGACSGTNLTATVTMSEARACTATFGANGSATRGSGGSMTRGSGGSIQVLP